MMTARATAPRLAPMIAGASWLELWVEEPRSLGSFVIVCVDGSPVKPDGSESSPSVVVFGEELEVVSAALGGEAVLELAATVLDSGVGSSVSPEVVALSVVEGRFVEAVVVVEDCVASICEPCQFSLL
jgi:hypothetical protein